MNSRSSINLSILEKTKKLIKRRQTIIHINLTENNLINSLTKKLRQKMSKIMRRKYNIDQTKKNVDKINEIILHKKTHFVSVFYDLQCDNHPADLIKKYFNRIESKFKFEVLFQNEKVNRRFFPQYSNISDELREILIENAIRKKFVVEELNRLKRLNVYGKFVRRMKEKILDENINFSIDLKEYEEKELVEYNNYNYLHVNPKNYRRDSKNNSVNSVEILIDHIDQAEKEKKKNLENFKKLENLKRFQNVIKEKIMMNKQKNLTEDQENKTEFMNNSSNLMRNDNNLTKYNKRSLLITESLNFDYLEKSKSYLKLIKSSSAGNILFNINNKKNENEKIIKFAKTENFIKGIKKQELEKLKRSRVLYSLQEKIKSENNIVIKKIRKDYSSDVKLPDVEINNSDRRIFTNQKELKKYDKESPNKINMSPSKLNRTNNIKEMINKPDLYKNRKRVLSEFIEKTKSFHKIKENKNENTNFNKFSFLDPSIFKVK